MFHVLSCAKWVNGSGWEYESIVETYHGDPYKDDEGNLHPDIDWDEALNLRDMDDEAIERCKDSSVSDLEYTVRAWETEDCVGEPVCEESVWLSEYAAEHCY